MQFDDAVSTNMSQSLKRFRIKVDPMYASYSNFRNIDGYEGYVLVETHDLLKVMVMSPKIPIVVIPKAGLLPDDKLDDFKQYITQALELDESNPLLGQISNCTDIDNIESFLKQSGKSDTDIVDLFKDYNFTPEPHHDI